MQRAIGDGIALGQASSMYETAGFCSSLMRNGLAQARITGTIVTCLGSPDALAIQHAHVGTRRTFCVLAIQYHQTMVDRLPAAAVAQDRESVVDLSRRRKTVG